MINLGDVNFSLGANTQGLQQSLNDLRSFQSAVSAAQTSVSSNVNAIASAFRRQEAAANSALNQTLNMVQKLNSVKADPAQVDRVTSAYQRLNSTLTSGRLAPLEYQRAMQSFRNELLMVQRGIKQVEVGGFVRGLENLSNSLVFIQGPLGGFATRVTTLVSLLKRGGLETVAFFGGLAAGGYTIYKLGSLILDAGRAYNQYHSQLLAVYGDQDRANRAFQTEIDIARNTGTSLRTVADEYAKFTIAARGAGVATQESNDIFQTFAAVGTKLQLGSEQMSGIFKAIEQMLSKGTIQAEELRGQLGDRLPGAFNIFAKALNVSTFELNKMLKSGQVLAADTLPKVVEVLRKQFGLGTGPVDNYATAVNNLQTAWFQLRQELDQQFGVTDKVISAYKSITDFLDRLRTNMKDVQGYLVIAASAFAAFVAPAILGGLVKVISLTTTLTKSVLALAVAEDIATGGAALILQLAAAFGGAALAAYEMSDSLHTSSDSLVTWGDYASVAFDRVKKFFEPVVESIGAGTSVIMGYLNGLGDNIAKADWWSSFKQKAYDGTNYLLNLLTNLGDALPAMLAQIPLAVADAAANAMNVLIEKVESGLNIVSDKLNEWIRAAQKWANVTEQDVVPTLKLPRIPTADLDAMTDQNADRITQIMSREKDILGQTASEWNKYTDQVEAAARARSHIIHPPNPRVGATSMDEGLGAANSGVGGLTAAQQRAADRQKAALLKVNEEIQRAQDQIDALSSGKGPAALEKLKEDLKIDKEVDQYAASLIRAGVASDVVKEKTEQLRANLEKLYELQQARRAIDEITNAWGQGLDAIGQALSSALATGQSVFKALASAAQKAAEDIFNTWFQLSITNPLKNLLFGMNMPMLGPLGSLFGLAKGGVISSGKLTNYALGGVPNGPITFPMVGGMGRMRENGDEGIFPLTRDNHGRLGVRSQGGGGEGTYVTNYIYVNGASGDDHVKQLVTEGVTTAMAEYPNTKTFQHGVQAANQKLRSQGKVR